VQLETNVLAKNNQFALENHSWLAERKICGLNIISSPGAGKTTLLERTLDSLRGHISCAVVVGDQQTDNDAKRLMGRGAPVCQIETHNSCHLDAERVSHAMKVVVSHETRLLLIENVGNLICPAAFALGESRVVSLLSITEGEDKPLKYPVVFSKSDVIVLTKLDLAPYLEFELNQCLRFIGKVAPQAKVLKLSAKTGEGMSGWLEFLESCVEK
jgi:hydrogenase nickel incorporation protein HypB